MEHVVDIRELVEDGATVGIGGNGTSRKPMALVRELVATGVRDLRIVSFLGSVEVEYLLVAGAVAEIHTAGVGLDAVGLAPRYRQARENGAPTVHRWSEGALYTALDAAARGVPSLPASTSPRSGVTGSNPAIKAIEDPFTGREVVQVRALPVDVALIHATAVDARGNIHVDGDLAVDDILARAAAHVVVSVEERDPDRVPAEAVLGRIWVDQVVLRQGGSWPTGCPPRWPVDDVVIAAWAKSKGEDRAVLEPKEVTQ